MNLKNFPKRLDSKISCLRITVPENLDLALEGLIRKVLKEQPKTDDIYSFAANYFETLLKIRDKAGAKFTSAQLCPFHNDEDAHEMIKLAGTFSKSSTETIRKKNEEYLPSETKNVARKKESDLQFKVQDKKNVRNSKSKKTSSNGKSAEENKRKMSKITKNEKLPMTDGSLTKEGKEQTELTDKTSNDNELGKNTKREESDDEDFLASDPIKELVEKELMMEANSKGKTREMNKSTATNDEIINQEEQKPADKVNLQPEINATNEETEKGNKENEKNVLEKVEENKNRSKEIEETKDKTVKEAKIGISKIAEHASEKSTPDLKEPSKGITVDMDETSNKKPEDVETENKESAMYEKSNKEKTKIIEETYQENISVKDVKEDKSTKVEIKSRPSENMEEIKITTDKTSDFNISKPERQQLTLETEGESQTINRQSPVRDDKDEIEEVQTSKMGKEATDKSSETLNDVTEKDKNKNNYSEVLGKDNKTDFIRHAKEQQKENCAETSAEISRKEIKSEEEEALNNQHQTRMHDQINGEKDIKPVETATKNENPESTAESKTTDTEVPSTVGIKPLVTKSEAKHELEVGKAEINNNQEPKIQEEKTTDDATTVTEEADAGNLKKDEILKEVSRKAEELSDTNNSIQPEQESKVTEETAEVNKIKIANQDVKENDGEILQRKTTAEGPKINETKSVPEQLISTNENTAEVIPELGSTVSETEKEEPSEVPPTDMKFYQSEDKVSEEREKLSNEYQIKINEDKLFGEKTQELVQSTGNKIQRANEIATAPQVQEREMTNSEKEEQNADQNALESQLINKEFSAKEKECAEEQTQGDEVSTLLDLRNANKPDHEQSKEALKSPASDDGDAQRKDDKAEPEEELFKVKDIQEIPRKEELENQKTDFEMEELCTVVDTHEISKESKTINENSTSEPKFEIGISESREDSPKPKEELHPIVKAQQAPKENEIDSNETEEKCKHENENTQNKQDKIKAEEEITEGKSPHIITIEVEKAKENQNLFQPSGERQIKTIHSHYYDTLKVPETVIKEYRVHNILPSAISPLVGVATSSQQNKDPKHEFLNKEERTETIVDDNVNAPSVTEVMENVTDVSLPAQAATPTKDLNFDVPQPVDHLKNLTKDTSFPANASNQNMMESIEQKSDSDDLVELMTPTSGFSLSLSELSWQTVSGLFLDVEKRHSSLEKEGIRYATQNTSDATNDSGGRKRAESKPEVEEIIHKTVISSSVGAVPIPPRDVEEINEETNIRALENGGEKKEDDKPEDKSPESSSDSSNEQISVSDDTPFISVEVKTVIETQILESDDDEDDRDSRKDQNGEERARPDVEIKIETTIDFRNEVEMTQPDSEPTEGKMETTDANRSEKNGSKFSLEIQGKSRHDKGKEYSSTEQTVGKEGSSGESDSTVSSAATEIKRTGFAKRNFSSARNLLSTQSLDLEKKNPLMKTRSLSAFRHGVTDFEVWNTIEKELEEAATKIQSKFRGYKTRKKLQRENAVQITTEESSVSTTPVEPEIKDECGQSTGEFHDSIVLSEHPR